MNAASQQQRISAGPVCYWRRSEVQIATLMKIATITPTRGDRPEFLKMALKLIKLQTQQPDEIIVVDNPSQI